MLGGAGEACWAHNPKVSGSKPLLAINFYSQGFVFDGRSPAFAEVDYDYILVED